MPWLWIVVAGLLEVVWASAMSASQGFTRPVPSLITLVALVASMGLLSLGLRSLPLGTAYAVWVGIGIAGTAVVGMLWLGEGVSLLRLGFLALLLVGIAGLKLTAPH